MSHYVFSDIHGNGILWDKIKDFLKPEDEVYFLGDAIDRGPDGWHILKEMLADNRFHMLLGNHEDMMYHSILKESGTIENDYVSPGEYKNIWFYNGGAPTYEAIKNDDTYLINKIMKQVKALPQIIETPDFVFTHAGFTPEREVDYLWDRKHFYQAEPNYSKFIIHGHTPSEYIKKELRNFNIFCDYDNEQKLITYDLQDGIIFYGNYKIGVDCGTAKNKFISLLNLDTLEIIKFEE